MRLQTGRLTLEPSAAEHADLVADLWADADAMRYMAGPRDRDKVKAVVIAGTPDAWSVFETASGAYVGDCFIHDKELEGAVDKEIVYVIAPAFWGRGYATEAAQSVLQHVALPRVTALIHSENAASIRVAQKLGMRHERDIERPDGRRMRLYSQTITVTK
ncbi:MAG: GNAT family N-acetyltransferase [Planctomycetota bacterium]|jgi:RimJ/RimL family protein N-acetyltransferase